VLKQLLHPEYNELVSFVVGACTYGDILEHSTLQDVMKIERNQRYYQQIKNANKILLEKGFYLENLPGTGYKVITPNEFVDSSLKMFEKASKKTQEAVEMLRFAPRHLMSQEYQDKYDYLITKVTNANSFLEGGVTEAKLLTKRVLKIND
jgi:hypothetical protein